MIKLTDRELKAVIFAVEQDIDILEKSDDITEEWKQEYSALTCAKMKLQHYLECNEQHEVPE